MGPAFQVPVLRWRDAEIVVEFLENVDEGRRRLDSERHREAKSVRLARIVVRVLPDDDGLDFIDGAKVEGCKNFRSGWIHHMVLRMFLQELCLDLLKVRLFELVGEQFQPRFFEFDGHNQVLGFRLQVLGAAPPLVMPAEAGISFTEFVKIAIFSPLRRV